MRTLDPKLIHKCFEQDEVLDRQRNPEKYMSVDELVRWVDNGCDGSTRLYALKKLRERVGEEKAHELTKHITCNLAWLD